MHIAITRTWDNQPLPPELHSFWLLEWRNNHLIVEVDATWHGDPPPPGPPGSTEGLWNYEVAELFLVGEGEHYTELELGPQGHYLLLQLRGVRQRVAGGLPLFYQTQRSDGRWKGRAEVPLSYLPLPIVAYNAFAISGHPHRHYAAFHPLGTGQPDFHRLSHYPSWPG